MSVPVMRMGLIGFADERYLCNLMSTRSQTLRWERWPFVDADALWVNGERAQPLRDHFVRVPSADPTQPATVLNLKEIDRPTAFTLPIGNSGFAPPHVFDPHAADSVAQVLQVFEQHLQVLGVHLLLARQIAERRYELRSPTYHLTHHGALVGVVNIAGDIGLLPTLTAADLVQAEWSGRPGAASAIPAHFARTTMAHVMWQYIGRTDEDLLPNRYRQNAIFFRRMPNVPSRFLKDSHLLLVSELGAMPQHIEQLQQSTGMGDRQITQTLAALYFAGSITTDVRRAADPRGKVPPGGPDGPASDINSGLIGDVDPPAPPRPGKRFTSSDVTTVPTPLEPSDR